MPASPICDQLPPWVSVGHYTTEPENWKAALVTMEHKLWPNGSTITYSFLDGHDEPELKETVNSAIAEYQRYANVNFKQLADGNKLANIRIMLKSGYTTSAIGIDALRMHSGGPSMKLGHTLGLRDEDIYPLALHVIGHALGLMHDEEGKDRHSNFPNPDENSVMWITNTHLGLYPRLSDSDKAWLVVNYPGRDATINGTTWTLMYSLGVLQLPAHVIASILTSSDVSKKRDLYTGYIIELYEHIHVKERVEAIKSISQDGVTLSHAGEAPTAASEEDDLDEDGDNSEPVAEALVAETKVVETKGAKTKVAKASVAKASVDELNIKGPPPLGDISLAEVPKESPASARLPSQPDDDEFSESVAAAVMHPQFRAALSNVVQQYINDNAPKLGLKPQPAAAQPSNAVQSAVPQHFLGALLPILLPTAIDLVSKLVQSGIQPNNIQSALAPNGIQSIGATGRVLSRAEQQVMNGFFTSIIGNPVFKSVLKGIVKTVTDQDEQ